MAYEINAMVVDLYHGDLVGGSGPALDGFKKAYDAGIRGIIHKASQGISYVDPAYERRRDAALQAGLLWGAYHFANDTDAEQQAEFFLKQAASPDAETLVALDWEPNSNHSMGADGARKFLQTVEAELGRKAVLYSGNLAKEKLGDTEDEFFGSHRLWLCQYGPKWRVQSSWQKPWLWQYAADGYGPEPRGVPGITVPGGKGIDMNSFDRTEEELKAEWAS
jgi:GH25 family lysozyme M1 (1,4-beta-N-acetylmuramidase)